MEKKSVFYLLVCIIAGGMLFLVVKLGLNAGFHPLSLALTQAMVALACFTAYVAITRFDLGKLDRVGLRNVLIIGVVAGALTPIVTIFGQQGTSVTNTGFILQLTTPFTILMAFIIVGERISKRSYLVIFVMVAGAFFLAAGDEFTLPGWGDGLLILGALFLGFSNALVKHAVHRVKNEAVSFFRFLFGTATLIIVVPIVLRTDSFNAFFIRPDLVIITGVLSFVFIFFFYRCIESVGPSLSSVFITSTAVVAAILGYVVLGETLSSIQIIGAVLILGGGYYLAQRTATPA